MNFQGPGRYFSEISTSCNARSSMRYSRHSSSNSLDEYSYSRPALAPHSAVHFNVRKSKDKVVICFPLLPFTHSPFSEAKATYRFAQVYAGCLGGCSSPSEIDVEDGEWFDPSCIANDFPTMLSRTCQHTRGYA